MKHDLNLLDWDNIFSLCPEDNFFASFSDYCNSIINHLGHGCFFACMYNGAMLQYMHMF